jgi:hypothetical protein
MFPRGVTAIDCSSDPTLSEVTADRFFSVFDEIRGEPTMDNRKIRAMLGLAVLSHLMDDHEEGEITAGMELFFAEVRVRVEALLTGESANAET